MDGASALVAASDGLCELHVAHTLLKIRPPHFLLAPDGCNKLLFHLRAHIRVQLDASSTLCIQGYMPSCWQLQH